MTFQLKLEGGLTITRSTYGKGKSRLRNQHLWPFDVGKSPKPGTLPECQDKPREVRGPRGAGPWRQHWGGDLEQREM